MTWLSLTRAASDSDIRWLTPPPHRTAYFSSARSPGIVLRVSRTCAPVPSIASTQRRVRVATPDRWPSRFRAVRSAVSRSRIGPVTVASTSPGVTRAPSALPYSTRSRPCPTVSKTYAATGNPATTPSCRETRSARRHRVGVDGRQRGDVAGDAEVLVQRAGRRSRRRRARAARVRSRSFLLQRGRSWPGRPGRGPCRGARATARRRRSREVVAPVRPAGLLAQPRPPRPAPTRR